MQNRSSRLALAALLAAAPWCAQQTMPQSGGEKFATVQGEVRDAATLAPIERAHVVLAHLDGTGERYGALTASDGFTITKIDVSGRSPATFEIRLDRAGYVDLTPDAQRIISLVPGGRKMASKFKLTPTRAITGRVFDSAGVPVEGTAVSAVTSVRHQSSTVTDDRGAYRLGGLPPGTYRIVARQESLPVPPEIRTDGTTEVHHSPTYYPAELDVKSAARIDVQAAADIRGIDIRLVRTPILRVSGRVISQSEAGLNAHVVLEVRDNGRAIESPSRRLGYM